MGPFAVTIPIPSRARLVSVYDTSSTQPTPPSLYTTLTGVQFIEGDDLAATTPDGVVIATLYPVTMIHNFTVPTNATHLVVYGAEGDEDPQPAKINVTWTLEL